MKPVKTAGVVKNGVVVPNIPIPEGFGVVIEFYEEQLVFTPEEQAEFDDWHRISHGLIEKIERLAVEADDSCRTGPTCS